MLKIARLVIVGLMFVLSCLAQPATATKNGRSVPQSYAEAAKHLLKRPAANVRWGLRIEYPGVMDLIETEAVIERLDALMAARQLEV